MPGWELIPGDTLVPAPWRNGLGTSRDIRTTLAPDGALLWQIGIADLEHDAPFSHFPHCDRIFTPIAGDPPPELAFNGGRFEPCPLLVPKPFPGDIPTTSRIPAPGRAFNLVWDRRHHTGTVAILHFAPGDPIHAPDAPIVALHCLSGRIAAAGYLLTPGDTIIGPGPSDPAAAAAEDSIVIVAAIR